MSDKTWKAAERRVARMFGTTRTPLSGGNGKQTRSDTLHPRAFIETKYRKRFAAAQLFRETEELARAEEKLPVVALVERQERRIYAVVPLDRKYLTRLLNELVASPDEPPSPENQS